MTQPRVVVLVPRRAGFADRDALWQWCRAWWETNFPDWPIFEGHHDSGLFNRSAALNRAAALAGDWDVALLIDADVICDPETTREAVWIADETRDHLVLPFTRRHNLTRSGSQRVMAGDRGSWLRFIGRTYESMVSSVVAVSRELWDRVGGFDERFEGWGFEDNAFASACETFGGPMQRLEGECWHLYHATAREGRRGTPSFTKNRALSEQYHAALGDVDRMRAVQQGVAAPSILRIDTTIPRILHRVVPVKSPDEAERWWQRFAELHPGWEFMTHRDPLVAADWPLTSAYWPQCKTGAQLAGLVRLEALWRWGGVYVDQDVEPYRSLEPLLGAQAFAGWEDRNCVPDAVMGARPEHPAIGTCLKLAIERLPIGTWESGAGVTTEVFPHRDDVLLLPPGSFYPYHYKSKHLRSRDHASEQPWAFVAHHWYGSWLAKSA